MMIQVSFVFFVIIFLILRSFYTVCWEEKEVSVKYLWFVSYGNFLEGAEKETFSNKNADSKR